MPDKVIGSQGIRWSYNGKEYGCWPKDHYFIKLTGQIGDWVHLPDCIILL